MIVRSFTEIPFCSGCWSCLAIGLFFSLEIPGADLPSGQMVSWGSRASPPVQPGSTFIGMAAGLDHSLAIKTNGTVIAWGNNFQGPCNVPPGLSNVIAVAAGGGGHSLALQSSGLVVGWGATNFNQAIPPSG